MEEIVYRNTVQYICGNDSLWFWRGQGQILEFFDLEN